jgi:hypothetical protein
VDENEIEFCKNLFSRFQYKEELIDVMIEKARAGEVEDYDEWESFLEESKKYQLN